MKILKKWTTVIALTAMITASSQDANAREYYTDAGGCAYEQSYHACSLVPAITFALVAIAAIVAVGLHNTSKGGHGHAHSDSD